MTATPQILGGRYEVGELLGRGGMAEVHLGHDTRLSRPVAIKMLRSDLARDTSFLVPVPPGGAVGRRAEPRLDRRGLRLGRGPRHRVGRRAGAGSLHRHGVRRGQDPARAPQRPLAPRARRGRAHHRGHPRRPGLQPPHGHRPPRHQAGERHDRAATATIKVMDFGIARADRRRQRDDDPDPGRHRHRPVPLARAGPGPARRRALRPLLHRLPAVRAAHRAAAVQGRLARWRSPTSTSARPRRVRRRFNADVDPALDAVVLHALAKDREAPLPGRRRVPRRPAGRAPRPPDQRRGPGHRGRRTPAPPAWPAPSDGRHGQPSASEAHHGSRRRSPQRPPASGNTATLPAIGHDPDEEEPRKRRGLGYVLLVVAVLGAIALMVIAGRSLFDQPPSGAGTVAVPSVVDLPGGDGGGQDPRRPTWCPRCSEVPSTKEEGTVVEQNPQANEQAPRGSTVTPQRVGRAQHRGGARPRGLHASTRPPPP